MGEQTVAATSYEPVAIATMPQSRAGRFLASAGLVIAGSLLLWLSAKIKVPFYPVPMTLQTLAVFLIAASYGSRLAVATVGLYLVEGALGLPVFAGTPEKGIGLAYMFGPTGGYLAGYLVAAAIVGFAVETGWARRLWSMFAAMLIGEAALLLMGFAWLAVLLGSDKAFAFGIGPFIVTDLVKVALAASLMAATGSLIGRNR